MPAQNITNEGTDFWFAFPECHDLTTATYQVNISANQATSGTVSIPGTSFTQNYSVTPGQITRIVLPAADAVITQSEILLDRAIHVTSLLPVVVYANTYHQFRSEASLVLPTSAIGDDYLVTSYPSQVNTTLKQSEFIIVAAGDSVTVEITTPVNTEGGQIANIPWTITLDTGQIYLVQAQNSGDDLTGSRVRSIDPGQSFALYNGHTWAWTFCNGNKDPLYEVAYPTKSWGREYILIPSVGRSIDLFRVVARDNNTDVFVDGAWVANINTGQFYEDTISKPTLVVGSKPVSVAQYLVTGQCDNAPVGDPSIVIINSNEQMFLDSVTFFTIREFAIDSNYVNIIMRTPDTNTLFFNSLPVNGWTVFIEDNNYSHVSFRVDTGSHTLTTTSCGFLAYIYGMGYAESYYYAAGVRLNDLNDSLSFTNISTGGNQHCVTDSILFQPQLSGGPALGYIWSFGDGDSSFLASPIHLYQDSGTYLITLIVQYQCMTDTIQGLIQILPVPTVEFGADTLYLCQANSAATLNAGNPGFQYLWNTGATTQSIVVTQSGSYSVDVYWLPGLCIRTDAIYVDIPVDGSIPNVFTPNADGDNDLFRIGAANRCSVEKLSIFNRWGELVFETKEPLSEFWDGKNSSGQPCNEGTYYWIVIDSESGNSTGYLTLLR